MKLLCSSSWCKMNMSLTRNRVKEQSNTENLFVNNSLLPNKCNNYWTIINKSKKIHFFPYFVTCLLLAAVMLRTFIWVCQFFFCLLYILVDSNSVFKFSWRCSVWLTSQQWTEFTFLLTATSSRHLYSHWLSKTQPSAKTHKFSPWKTVIEDFFFLIKNCN